MFRNMFRSKEERQRDFEEFTKRMCPLGEAQLEKLKETVIRLSQKYTNDPMIFYYYLSAADNYRTERDETLITTLVFLRKAKPRLPIEGIKELIALMELNIGLESLDDFPEDAKIIDFANKEVNYPEID